MPIRRTNRRDFLKHSTAAAAAAGMAPYFWTSQYARAEGPSDKLTVAAIGTSIYTDKWGVPGKRDGQGSMIGRKAAELGNMAAVADVNLVHAEAFADDYEGKCQVYQDYRRLLEREDIDAVTIGTPDHWHVKIAIDAMRSGKDVYCEKPLTLTIDEGRQIIKVAEETGRVIQVGTQQRSEYNDMFLTAVVLARSGRLGKKLHALSSVGTPDTGGPFETAPVPEGLDWEMWLGQAPKVAYTPQRCNYDFRWWLEYSGGQTTDWGVHHTDIAMWALDPEEKGVVELEGQGDFPLGREATLAKMLGEGELENAYNVSRSFDVDMTLGNGNTIKLYSGDNELIISGERGRIRVNRGGLTGKPIEDLTDADRDWIKDEIVELCHGKQPGNHMKNFFECVKDRGKTVADVRSHVNAVNACHMANLAMLLGRKIRFDTQKYEFPGDAEANKLAKRAQRAPYAIDV